LGNCGGTGGRPSGEWQTCSVEGGGCIGFFFSESTVSRPWGAGKIVWPRDWSRIWRKEKEPRVPDWRRGQIIGRGAPVRVKDVAGGRAIPEEGEFSVGQERGFKGQTVYVATGGAGDVKSSGRPLRIHLLGRSRPWTVSRSSECREMASKSSNFPSEISNRGRVWDPRERRDVTASAEAATGKMAVDAFVDRGRRRPPPAALR